MLETGIYQKTIIPFKIPFLGTLTISVITYFIIQRDYSGTYQYKNFFSFLLKLLFHLVL